MVDLLGGLLASPVSGTAGLVVFAIYKAVKAVGKKIPNSKGGLAGFLRKVAKAITIEVKDVD